MCPNEELEYKKIVNCANKSHVFHLGEYLDKVERKWKCRAREDE
jgi:hypothetical protein